MVFYEIGRFIELLGKNNPNLLEMLNVSPEHIIYKHPIINQLTSDLFLSKLCKDTFAGYAFGQIKKARGLNKKIVNPIDKERKTPLNFCFVTKKQGATPIKKWLEQKGYSQENCGLVKIPHIKDLYGVYYDEIGEFKFKGILQKSTSNDISLSSIPKGLEPITYLHYNKDGYKKYCKDYKAYWDWVEKRNKARYENTISHGKNYDAKNMMHTFRLLDMAEEILRDSKIIVKRPNREQLLKIRAGEFNYDELVTKATEKLKIIEALYETSTLPKRPNIEMIEKVLIQIRNELY